jgi:putative flippase GtrA
MGVCFVFYAWVFIGMGKDPLRSFLATAIGLVVGGIVNCCINYKFTFQAKDCSVKAVVVKYILIWGGSFFLNLMGTTAFDHLLQQWDWLYTIGMRSDGIFAFARVSVSLVVSLAWNFVLQKNFVYKPTKFDRYAICLVDFITFQYFTNKRNQH